MILTQLVVHNFGIYRGRHTLDLKPPSAKRCIVLIGGLNGGGKTTLLDALQLVLYGKLAQCSNRGDLSYEEYLRRAIHRGVPASEGAALELEFSHISEGRDQLYRVHRSWVSRDKTVRERLEVSRKASPSLPLAPDPVLTESWAEQIEEFIPQRLSKFFFFDGEKVEALADLDRSRDVLATAIQSLLGLDLVDQLSTDLVVLERRKNTERKSAVEREAIEAMKREVEALDEKRKELTDRSGAATTVVDRATRQVHATEERFRQAGGEAFARRGEVEARRQELAREVSAREEELCEIAEGVAPLLLVSDLLDVVAHDAEDERDARASQELGTLLTTRDDATVSFARRAGGTEHLLAQLLDFLSADRAARSRGESGPRYLNLAAEALDELASVRASARSELTANIERLVKRVQALRVDVENLDRMLAAAPDEAVIAETRAAYDEARRILAERQQELANVNAEREQAVRDHDAKWAELGRLMERAVDDRHRQESLHRIVTHSERVRESIGRFREAVLLRHVQRIELLVLEGFQHLLRKESLVSAVQIDPRTFAMTLRGMNNEPLPPERLSAGERQLLAIALIWGIARASGRAVPVAVDTPLGRLDSVHRRLMVERYFPSASHQVLLFSTDKEIDGEYYEKLRPFIGHEYHLRYDDKRGATTIEEGYQW